MLKLKLGKSTKIEPIVNPIIEYKVWEWYFSNKNLVNFIKTKAPKTKPIAMGIKTEKLRFATEER